MTRSDISHRLRVRRRVGYGMICVVLCMTVAILAAVLGAWTSAVAFVGLAFVGLLGLVAYVGVEEP